MTTISTTTSSTRPGSPSAGNAYFETDTKNYIIYDGANWRAYEWDATTANILSLEFDGGDRLDTTYGSSSDAASISFWMKSSDLSSYSVVVDNRDSGGTAQCINLWRPTSVDQYGQRFWYPTFKTSSGTNTNDPNYTQGGVILLASDASHDDAYTAGVANSFFDGGWHHVVVTLANEDVSGTLTTRYIMYKDGVEFINQLCTTANGWVNNNTFVGGDETVHYTFGDRRVGSSIGYSGKLDQMAFFESVLSPAQVSSIYNSGNGGDLINLGFSPAAYYRIGYYPLEDTNSDSSTASAGQDIGTVADYSGNNADAVQTTTSKKPNYVADPAF